MSKDKRLVGFDVSTCIWKYSIRVHQVYLLLCLFLIYFKCCFYCYFFEVFDLEFVERRLFYNRVKTQETGGIWNIYLEFCITVHEFFYFFAYFWFIWNVILIAIFYFEDFEREFGKEVCTNSYLFIYWSQGSIHPTNFGCDISVRLPVHFLGEGGGKEIRCQPVGGGLYYIFFAGNRVMIDFKCFIAIF